MTRNFNEAAKEAMDEYNVDLTKIPEDDRLDNWPWSKKYFDKIDTDMAKGCFVSMIQMLDLMGVPKGSYSDDRLYNFIVMYNKRGDLITSLTNELEALRNNQTDKSIFHLIEQNKILTEQLVELANWPIHTDNSTAKGMKVVAASVVDPNRVKILQALLDNGNSDT